LWSERSAIENAQSPEKPTSARMITAPRVVWRRVAVLMTIGHGSVDRTLSREQVREVVRQAVTALAIGGKRVLTIIPDGTRTMPMPMMFDLLQEEIGRLAAACDYLVALGTHPLMSDSQLSLLMGRPVVNERCGTARVLNHHWDIPSTFADIGTIPQTEVTRISGGLLREEIPVRINRLIFDYDQLIICGPVFPHEVVGFSGGNKYLFPGISGNEMIDWTHWLGALLGSYEIIGTDSTPVRQMIDQAAELVRVPVACFSLVVSEEGTHGVYFGSARDAWKAAAELASRKHITWMDRAFRRVLSVMPERYADIWTAAKGMYKVEPAIADGGEVVIYAPHITEFSYTHGPWIDQIGYHCRDYFLSQWERFSVIPRGVIAHSTHLNGKGTFHSATGIETRRITVTLATGIPAERCRRANLGYLDPAKVRIEDWQKRENEGIKVIPRAGEVLFRLKSERSRDVVSVDFGDGNA
jgi:nickel-dependent lactate racemase